MAYCRLIAICYVPFLIVEYILAFGPDLCPDFAAFWGAGRLAWTSGALAYDPQALQALEWFKGFQPFINPPPFLLIVTPFGLLPFGVAFPLWVALCTTLFVWTARRLSGFWPALAYTPTLMCQAIGQNGLITGSLFFGAAALLEKRPYLAGLLLGGLIIKPHLALFVPLALLAAGHWRAIWGAATSSLGLLALAYLVFGRKAYEAFLAALPRHSEWTLGNQYVFAKMQSLYAFLRPMVGEPLALGAQVVVAALMGLLVWRVWRRDHSVVAKMALLIAATSLALPYLFGYDLVMLLLPLSWLGREAWTRGFLPYERLMIGGAFLAPIISHQLSVGLHVSPGVLSSAVILWSVCRRLRIASPQGTLGASDLPLVAAPS